MRENVRDRAHKRGSDKVRETERARESERERGRKRKSTNKKKQREKESVCMSERASKRVCMTERARDGGKESGRVEGMNEQVREETIEGGRKERKGRKQGGGLGEKDEVRKGER